MIRRSVVLLLSAAVLAGCGTESTPDGGTEEPSSPSPAGNDSAGQAACSRFREVAGDAFGEVLSEREVRAGLQEVANLAAESTNPSIRDNADKAAGEANVRALIDGEPDPTLDALADACNAAFPI